MTTTPLTPLIGNRNGHTHRLLLSRAYERPVHVDTDAYADGIQLRR